MNNYRFRGKDIEVLTREEAIEALRQALDRVTYYEGIMNNPYVAKPSRWAEAEAQRRMKELRG